MSKVLVTGVNGFVGGHLVHELQSQGCEVFGVGRETKSKLSTLSAYYVCDLTDPAAVSTLPLQGIDSIINLAGLAQVGSSFGQEELYNNVNVGVLQVIGDELLRQKLHPRVIAISTGAVYNPGQPLPLTEDSSLIKDGSPYAISKILMEQAASALKEKGLDCIIMRPFNHIGPGQDGGFLLPDLYNKIIAAKEDGTPVRVGDLTTRRDYTDVRDVVRAYTALALTEQSTEDIYNVCSGTSHSGQEILDLLKKNIPGAADVAIQIDQTLIRPNDPKELVGSNERIQKTIGWQPRILFKQTIKDFVDAA